ncbi:hypothetical protein P4479_14805 [Brevibacillus agri]|uniref:hypothetical protein n=1 Tax=Brevibacillus agri TaxID=51101 RepID=UPI002E1D5123|nr:hypothetical protein [Brevibacillus agri]
MLVQKRSADSGRAAPGSLGTRLAGPFEPEEQACASRVYGSLNSQSAIFVKEMEKMSAKKYREKKGFFPEKANKIKCFIHS